VMVVRESALPAQVVLRVAQDWGADELAWRLVEESGEEHGERFVADTLPDVARRRIDDQEVVARRLTLGPKPSPGYHRLCLLRGELTLAQMLLIVAPDACYQPEAVRMNGRLWGPALQLYAVRSQRNWGMGDLTDLRVLLEQWAARGAHLVGLNPMHALFPHNPDHASPYSPSSRLFLNSLYLDPESIDDFSECDKARELVHSAAFQARLRELRGTEHVDYPGVAAAKMPVLELLYASFRSRHLALDSDRSREFRNFQTRAGPALLQHALFEALQERFFREDPSVWGWPAWPLAYHDPGSPQVARFAEANRERVEFYEWLQWQVDRQLGEVKRRAFELQLGVGLYGDLAVSVDRGGAETWSNKDLYAVDATVGAPPDDFNLAGQNWGLPPFNPRRLIQSGFAPFIATLRANMRHAGALRVDHVMGLMRLFWIASGANPSEGAYVRYPLQELLGIVALESQRNRCMVIGEDLGTVPDEVRAALPALQVLSCRILYFERRDGEFKAPSEYPEQALVAATTHDLPTLAGFWEARDLALREELSLFPSDEARQWQAQERCRDRARLLLALEREGLLPAQVSTNPASAPTMTAELARAVHAYLARTPCKLFMVQLEDVLGMLDQVNLPGTSGRYPNWRRKVSLDLERWSQDGRFIEMCDTVSRARAKR